MAHAFFLGIDASTEDGAAVSILEKERNPSEDAATFRLDRVLHLDGSPEDVAGRVQTLVADTPYTGRTQVAVRRDGDAGQAIADALDAQGLTPTTVAFTDGDGATAGDDDEIGVQLSTLDAVTTLVDAYRNNRLHVEDRASDHASGILRDLQRITEAIANASQGDGDVPADRSFLDGVDAYTRSAALAAWIGSERTFDPTSHLKERAQTTPPGTP